MRLAVRRSGKVLCRAVSIGAILLIALDYAVWDVHFVPLITDAYR